MCWRLTGRQTCSLENTTDVGRLLRTSPFKSSILATLSVLANRLGIRDHDGVNLNEIALVRCNRLIDQAEAARVHVLQDKSGARIVDCGVNAPGGLRAGSAVAEVCLAGLGRVELLAGDRNLWSGVSVTVQTDQPVAACMASQYAGWQIPGERFFAMGSGPMRAARGREELFDAIGYREDPRMAVGVLESESLPQEEICREIASACSLPAENLTLLVAPTTSIAGTIQVVARTVETALHKMHELGLDIRQVVSGFGAAPLPPVAADHLTGIGRTNDAVLYGGQVTLWISGDDDVFRQRGPQIPSCASPDYGEPFADIFEKYNQDFYKIDPMLFSPAMVHLINVDTGRSFRFGEFLPDVLKQSFCGE